MFTAQTNGAHTHTNGVHTTGTQSELPPKENGCSWLTNGLKWFCGIDSQQNSSPITQSYAARLRDLTSLRQSRRERAVLYTALAFLFVLDVFLYVFFSTGSDFGLLRKSHDHFNSVTFSNDSIHVSPVFVNSSFSR
jgi:hypothetical protein